MAWCGWRVARRRKCGRQTQIGGTTSEGDSRRPSDESRNIVRGGASSKGRRRGGGATTVLCKNVQSGGGKLAARVRLEFGGDGARGEELKSCGGVAMIRQRRSDQFGRFGGGRWRRSRGTNGGGVVQWASGAAAKVRRDGIKSAAHRWRSGRRG